MAAVMKEKIINNPVVDPQDLFKQFSPTLLFDSPRVAVPFSPTENWYTVAEQTVPADRNAFWHTIKKWTEEPNYAIPPVERAEINQPSNDNNEQTHHINILGQPFETIQRTLIPKRKSKDAPFAEKIQYYEQDNEECYVARVVYQPATINPRTLDVDQFKACLPFYYPKVRAYSFVYTCHPLSAEYEDLADQAEGTLRLEIVPCVEPDVAITEAKMQYALKTLLHKLFKWCIQSRLGYKKHAHHDVLVPKEEYLAMYQHMKSTYASSLVSNWTEKTDPKKFVFEDIAIASYLLCLWKVDEARLARKPTFVDLGCGNGLLTHLLVSEGYKGYGVDMAERKIWSSLCQGNSDVLRAKTLIPTQECYPEADWLLGNHADELVPWIPVIAAKSGAQCNFLVIPCCFYGLDGTRALSLGKMAEEEGGKYKAYCKYIKTLASRCGFECEEDDLRIPSTRNVAIVGRHRRTLVTLSELEAITASAQAVFVPRKSDREKEELRRELKRTKIES